jgi:hypothetical protein
MSRGRTFDASKSGGGRWKSSASDKPPPKPVPVVERPSGPPQSLAERITSMTETELQSLLGNAERVSKLENNKKQAEALELLPLLAAELLVRKAAKADAAGERNKLAAAARAKTRARKLRDASGVMEEHPDPDADEPVKADADEDEEESEDEDADEDSMEELR